MMKPFEVERRSKVRPVWHSHSAPTCFTTMADAETFKAWCEAQAKRRKSLCEEYRIVAA